MQKRFLGLNLLPEEITNLAEVPDSHVPVDGQALELELRVAGVSAADIPDVPAAITDEGVVRAMVIVASGQ
jgi:hypothetical protein